MIYLRDAMVVLGAGMVAYGSGLVYRPAGVIVAGLFLFSAGIAGALRAKPQEPTE